MALSLPVNAACIIYDGTHSNAVGEAFRNEGQKGYKFKNYDVVCNKLHKANASILFAGDYGVLAGRAYAWVAVTAADRDNVYLNVPAYGRFATYLNTDANTSKAREILWKAINDTLDTWPDTGLDDALAELEQVRKSLQKTTAPR